MCAFLAILLLFCTFAPIAASAVAPRVRSIIPALSFSGTTAICEVSVNTDYMTDTISAVIKLWSGSTCVKTWVRTATGYLTFNESVSVSKGEYTLTVDTIISGTTYPQVSVTATCN